MQTSIQQQITGLHEMTVRELRQRYRDFGRKPSQNAAFTTTKPGYEHRNSGLSLVAFRGGFGSHNLIPSPRKAATTG